MGERSSENAKAKEKVSAGFKLEDEDHGLSIYRNKQDYVISIDMTEGAKLGLFNGAKVSDDKKSAYGGANPELRRLTAAQALEGARKTNAKVVCVSNGAFFSTLKEAAAPIAFSLKDNNKIVSEGFAPINKHSGHRLTLAFDEDSARILPFDNKSISGFKSISESSAIVSLSPKVNMDAQKEKKIGRTFIGLANQNEQGDYTKILIFVSAASTQTNAEKTLQRFGANPVLMLDGGGSSQLMCDNDKSKNYYVRTARKVPQFLTMTPGDSKSQNLPIQWTWNRH